MSVEVGAVVIAVVLYIMFASFRFKKVEKEAEVEAANVSVEIVREIPGVKIKPLSDVELQYPKKDLWRGPLVTRGDWMVGKREYFRYSTEEEDERGITPIRLEGWVEERTYHHLLCNYGDLFTTRVNWDGWVVTLNIIACQSVIPVDDMPRVIETGTGVAFVVSSEAFNFYRKYARAPVRHGEVPVGRKFIMHCIVDRSAVDVDFNASAFNDWPAGMVNEMIAMRRPGINYPGYSAEELGLVEVESEEEEHQGGNAVGGERLLEEVEAEPMKSGVKPTNPQRELGESPKLARMREERLNDVDLVSRKSRDRKRSKRKWGKRMRRGARSPLRLTREQELWIVGQLVLGVEPNATEERIRASYDEILRGRGEVVGQESVGQLHQYGSAHGGWPLSQDDKADIDKLMARSPPSSPLPPLINSTTSSVVSPRGELSQNLGSSASLEFKSPASKRMRKGTEDSATSSVAFSPFLAMKSEGGRVVSISSSSSEGVGRDEPGRARVNLGELLGSGRLQFPDDGLLSTIHLDVFVDDAGGQVKAEDGEVSRDESESDSDPSLED